MYSMYYIIGAKCTWQGVHKLHAESALTVDFQRDTTVNDSNSKVIHRADKATVVCSVDCKGNVALKHFMRRLSGSFSWILWRSDPVHLWERVRIIRVFVECTRHGHNGMFSSFKHLTFKESMDWVWKESGKVNASQSVFVEMIWHLYIIQKHRMVNDLIGQFKARISQKDIYDNDWHLKLASCSWLCNFKQN